MGSKQSSLLRVPIDVPSRSGHNLSHSNGITGKCGTLIPVLCEELLPNDTVSLGSKFHIQLPPMASDFIGRVDFVLEAFFVPNRLCWGGWESFITHPTNYPIYPDGTPVQSKPSEVPYFVLPTGSQYYDIPVDSLLHYLDYGKRITGLGVGHLSVLSAIAYHLIWDTWYRDSRVQTPLFYRSPSDYTASVPSRLPYLSTLVDGGTLTFTPTDLMLDGVSVSSLRQRNWVRDYFTSASPLPQSGGAEEVKFDTTSDTATGAGTGVFSIATLRAANSLQMWKERHNLVGDRYIDQIQADFGIRPADAILDRPLFLGRHRETVYNRTVMQTAPPDLQASLSISNSVGAKKASSNVLGEGSLVDKFTASEHGFLMVLASLVPRPVYGSGMERRVLRTMASDYPWPLLAGMGDQAILQRELDGDNTNTREFGYTDLYAECKFRNDKLHGQLRDGEMLYAFALQRSFEEPTQISSDFLLIPTNYLDQVQVVDTASTGFSFWGEIYFPFRKISTIPAYSQPTLANLEHAHKEYVMRGGTRL